MGLDAPCSLLASNESIGFPLLRLLLQQAHHACSPTPGPNPAGAPTCHRGCHRMAWLYGPGHSQLPAVALELGAAPGLNSPAGPYILIRVLAGIFRSACGSPQPPAVLCMEPLQQLAAAGAAADITPPPPPPRVQACAEAMYILLSMPPRGSCWVS